VKITNDSSRLGHQGLRYTAIPGYRAMRACCGSLAARGRFHLARDGWRYWVCAATPCQVEFTSWSPRVGVGGCEPSYEDRDQMCPLDLGSETPVAFIWHSSVRAPYALEMLSDLRTS